MADTPATTIRLTDEDRKNVEAIIATGAAQNTAEAIRAALAIAPMILDRKGFKKIIADAIHTSFEELRAKDGPITITRRIR